MGRSKILPFLSIVILLGQFSFAQTVTYTQQTGNYYSTFTSGTAGNFNQGSFQLGMYANTSGSKQVVSWRKFRTDGSGSSTSDRSLQVGDQFVVTLSATRAYGRIGFALLASPSAGSYANRESNYAISFNLDGPLYGGANVWGNWYAKYNAGATSVGSGNVSGQQTNYKNFTFTLTLIAPDRMNATWTDGTTTSNLYDIQLNTSNPITDYSIFLEDDYDGGQSRNIFWGLGAIGTQHSLTNSGSLNHGQSNSTYTVSGAITNGLDANSASANTLNNTLAKNGTGNLTLNATNTYVGQTQLNNGELWIGASGSIASASGIFIGNGAQTSNVTKLWLSNTTGGTTFANNFTINNGNANTRIVGGLNTSGTHTFSGNITNNSANLNLSALNAGGTTDFTGVISGSNPLLTEGLGVVKLSNAGNSYTGGTTLRSGTLSIAANGALGSGSLTIGNGITTGTLAITGTTSRSLGISVTDGSTAGVIDVASGQTFTFSGVMSQTGSSNLTKYGKSGSGTFVVSGNSTYVGQIQIGDGAVIVQNNNGLGTNATTVNRGIDLGLNVGDVSMGNNVVLQATNGITVPQSIYIALNTGGATRTISFNGASGSASFSSEIYLDGNLTVSGGSGTLTFGGKLTNTGGIIATGGVVILTAINHDFTGSTNINSGAEVRVNPTANATYASQVVLNGGALSSTGIASTRTFTSTSTLLLSANSTIALGTGSHSLNFAASNGLSWSGTLLTITGWAGTAGASGTAGKIFVGNSATGLTQSQLDKITFSGYPAGAKILSTGEIVPKVTPIVTVIVGSYTYNGLAQGPNSISTLTPAPTSVTYSYVGVSGTTYASSATPPTNAGSYTVTATIATDANYYTASSSATSFAITAASVTITPTAGQSKIFGASDPTFTYSASPSVTITGLLSRSAGENAGTYAYTLGTLSAGSNYTLSLGGTNTFAITPASVTVTPTAGQSKIFGAADPTFTYSASPSVTITGSLSRNAGENAGTYAYTLGTLSAGSNYTLSLGGTNTFAITPASVTITPTAGQSKVFGASDPTFTYSASPSVTITGSLGRNAGENVGTYAYTLGTLSAGSNYTLSLGGTNTFAITPASVTVTPTAGQSKVFGASDPTFTYSASPSVTITGSLSRSAGENAGTYAYTLGTLSAGSNYTLSLDATNTFAITPASVTVTPTAGQSKVFGAADPTFTYAASPSVTITGSLSRSAGENAGTYAYTLGTSSAGSNYTLSLGGTNTFAITPASVTVTPTAGQSKVFGAADPTFTYAASPSVTIIGSLSRSAGENAGTYAYTLGTLSAGSNYTLSLDATNTFAITPASVTVTPTAGQSKVFGAADPTFTYSASPSVTITGSLSRSAGENAGTYAYTLGTLSAGSNYTLSLGGANTFSINAALLTITGITANNKVFDGTTTATLSGTAVYNGLQNGDVFTVSGTASASFDNAGPGTGIVVTVTGYTAPSANYTLLQPTGLTADITPSLPTASNNGPVCEGGTLTLSTALVPGATYAWTGPNSFSSAAQNPSVTTVTAAAAGVYSVTITVNGATSAAATTTVIINPAITNAMLSGTTSICFGGNTNLQVAITGGTSPFTVILNDGSTNFTASSNYNTGDNINVVPLATTTYSLVSVTSSTGCTGTINPVVTATITVNSPTVITVPASPVSQTAYVNDPSPASLTLTATGTSLTYQWFSNTVNSNAGGTSTGSGNGGQTNSYTPPTNVVGTKYYYCEVTGSCGTASSSAVSVTVTNTNTWKQGNATNNWSIASNWSGNAVPTGINDAVIPVGNTPYPVLSASSAINNLTIDPTATAGLGGFTLTVNGTITGTGTLSGSATSSLVTNATTTVRFTAGANTLKNLNVTGGTTTLANALSITGGTATNTYGTVTVSSGATLASNGNLTIRSNQYGTARVAAGATAGNYITGDVTVERYIPQNASRAWRLLSVPTKGTKTIKQTWQENQSANANGLPGFGTLITSNLAAAPLLAAGFDVYSTAPSVQSYTSGTQVWTYLGSTNSSPIETTKGYFLYIRGDRSVGVAPTFPAPSVSATTLRTTGTLYQGNATPAISIGAGKYEPVGNIFASAIDFTGLTKTGGISNTFYVWDAKLVVSATSMGGYQTFNGSVGFTPATPGGSYAAGVPNTTIESGEAFMLGATGSAGTVAIPESSKTTGNQLNPFRPSAQPAQFRTSLLKVNGSTAVFADNNIVVFDAAYSDAADGDDALRLPHVGESLDIVRDNKSLIIEARQPVSGSSTISFRTGQLQAGQQYRLSFSTLNMNTTGLTAFVEDSYLHSSTAINLVEGSVYSFTVVPGDAGSGAADRFSVVFRKAGSSSSPAISVTPGIVVSPNPVEGSVVHLQFKNELAGRYGIRLLDNGGKVVLSTFAAHAGGTGTQLLNLPSAIARGAYQLEVTAPDKNKQVQTIFINSIK